jgi:hypothetical protein
MCGGFSKFLPYVISELCIVAASSQVILSAILFLLTVDNSKQGSEIWGSDNDKDSKSSEILLLIDWQIVIRVLLGA